MLWGLGGYLLLMASTGACRSRLSRVPVPLLALWKCIGNERASFVPRPQHKLGRRACPSLKKRSDNRSFLHDADFESASWGRPAHFQAKTCMRQSHAFRCPDIHPSVHFAACAFFESTKLDSDYSLAVVACPPIFSFILHSS